MTIDTKTVPPTARDMTDIEAHFHELFECLPGMITVTGADGELEYCNRQILDLVGASMDDLVDLQWANFLHPEDAKSAVDEWLRCSQAKIPFQFYYRVRCKDGIYRWHESLVRPLLDEAGNVVKFYGLLNDVDDLRRAADERKRRDHQLCALIDSIPALVWRSDGTGNLTYINQRAADYAGLSASDDPSLLAKRIHPDDEPVSTAAWQEALRTQRPATITHRLQRFDGCYRWFEVRAQPILDDEGVVDSWYGFAVDVDEEVRLNEQVKANRAALERASRIATTAELSATIAHEINQPLAAITVNSAACRQWLSTKPPNIERAKLAMERISRDTQGVSDVVARVKTLFKGGSFERDHHDFNSIVRESCALMDNELTTAGVRLTQSLAQGIPPAWVDRVQIQQLVVNLIRNASEAINSGNGLARTIAVATRATDFGVGLTVTDSGPGFSDPTKAFDTFYTTKDHGMGIGLAICKTIAEAHHATLVARHDPMEGTILELVIPWHSEENSGEE